MPIDAALKALADRWAGAEASERANFSPYLNGLCQALGVEAPGPAGSGYQFELSVKVMTRDGVETTNFLDCWRGGFFTIEAKDEEAGKSTDLLLRRAFGQVRNYVTYAPGGMTPFIMVMDVAKTLIVWDRWKGFILSSEEAQRVLSAELKNKWVVRPYRNGRDCADRPRDHYVIDFALMTEDEARAFAVPFQLVADRVRPERQANNRASYARLWWRFGEPRADLRPAVQQLDQFIVTVDTSRRRFFTFLPAETVVDDKLVIVASTDSWTLGALYSSIHLHWAAAAGGRLGVGNDPVYAKTLCFDPFPFPDPPSALRAEIGAVAEKLDAHRKAAIERDEAVTMTGMYNVVEKLKSGEALTPKERKIHEIAACGVLKDLHDELDVLVAKAYGWEWPLSKDVILEKLVALHDERVKEEKVGKVRWLRPDYQIPRFGKDLPKAEASLGLTDAAPAKAKKAKTPAWPADVISQIHAVKRLLESESLSADDIATRFTGAKVEIIRRHLDILLVMGEVMKNPDGRFQGAA